MCLMYDRYVQAHTFRTYGTHAELRCECFGKRFSVVCRSHTNGVHACARNRDLCDDAMIMIIEADGRRLMCVRVTVCHTAESFNYTQHYTVPLRVRVGCSSLNTVFTLGCNEFIGKLRILPGAIHYYTQRMCNTTKRIKHTRPARRRVVLSSRITIQV